MGWGCGGGDRMTRPTPPHPTPPHPTPPHPTQPLPTRPHPTRPQPTLTQLPPHHSSGDLLHYTAPYHLIPGHVATLRHAARDALQRDELSVGLETPTQLSGNELDRLRPLLQRGSPSSVIGEELSGAFRHLTRDIQPRTMPRSSVASVASDGPAVCTPQLSPHRATRPPHCDHQCLDHNFRIGA